jgi:tetratricopeptide (TPR) repeat protein
VTRPGPPTCSARRCPTAATRSTCEAAPSRSTSSRAGSPPRGEVEHALRCADRALSLYELDEDNRALGEAHLAYAQRLLDLGDAEAGRHLAAARNLLGAHRILVEDARQALLVGDAEIAAQRAAQAVRALGEGDGAHLGDAQLVLARVQDELGEVERAEAAYVAAIEAIRGQESSARDLARAYRWYGKFLKRIGRAEAALEAFELAADLAPSNQDALAPAEARSNASA